MKICSTEYYSQRVRSVNIFCSNEADEFSVFCSKLPYLVGHNVSFNGSSDVSRRKKRYFAVLLCADLNCGFCDPRGVKWKLKFLSAFIDLHSLFLSVPV